MLPWPFIPPPPLLPVGAALLLPLGVGVDAPDADGVKVDVPVIDSDAPEDKLDVGDGSTLAERLALPVRDLEPVPVDDSEIDAVPEAVRDVEIVGAADRVREALAGTPLALCVGDTVRDTDAATLLLPEGLAGAGVADGDDDWDAATASVSVS